MVDLEFHIREMESLIKKSFIKRHHFDDVLDKDYNISLLKMMIKNLRDLRKCLVWRKKENNNERIH